VEEAGRQVTTVVDTERDGISQVSQGELVYEERWANKVSIKYFVYASTTCFKYEADNHNKIPP
jgi:hypothetical protein